MKITVFTTTTCPYCKMLKDYLTEKSVTFEEKLVDTDDMVRDEMLKVSGGFLGVPFTLIENEGNSETIIGFDKGRIDKLLSL